MSNHLPLRMKRDPIQGYSFEWDEDALIAQAKEGLPDDMDAVFVGCLPVEVEGHEQEVSFFNCASHLAAFFFSSALTAQLSMCRRLLCNYKLSFNATQCFLVMN